jgi:predicted house-cleaning noncanonical NTP pyrophosphatase (MazG superfamily)
MRFNKLVRDKIPEIIKESGKTPVTRVASEEEYLQKLEEKLKEEVNEFLESKDVEELADVLDVIYAICDAKGISRETLERIRTEKFNKRGGFSKRIILEEVRS